MTIETSPSESNRFGMRVGRCRLPAGRPAHHIENLREFDVVIIRTDAANAHAALELAMIDDYTLFTADHLLFWERQTAGDTSVELPDGWAVTHTTDVIAVRRVVRDSFAGYANHYRANPLFSDADVLDGYCEWAESMAVDSRHRTFLLRDDHGAEVGVALVEESEIPDVRLAGLVGRVQAEGHYSSLLGLVGKELADDGFPKIQISTQSTNVRVMRTWARMGFVPASTVATHHLVRTNLLMSVR